MNVNNWRFILKFTSLSVFKESLEEECELANVFVNNDDLEVSIGGMQSIEVRFNQI